LGFGVLALALYLGLSWLATLVGIGLVLMLLPAALPRGRPAPVPAGKPQPEEVLTPVIVQDVGEAPYLYPPDFRLKLKPDWPANTFFEWASSAAASTAFIAGDVLRGTPLARRSR
jgi:hypothetical protein